MRVRNVDGVSSQLGIGQEVLASALGISRSALAMHESALRPLPLDGLLQLNPMLRAMDAQAPEAQKRLEEARAQHCRELLQARLLQNNREQYALTKKLRPQLRSYEKLAKSFQLDLALENFQLKDPDAQHELKRTTHHKAGKLLNKVLKTVATLEIKLELLAAEEKAIVAALTQLQQ